MTQEEAVAKAGRFVSTSTWRFIESARRSNYRPATLSAVARALDWQDGSIEAIALGGEPIGVHDVTELDKPTNDEKIVSVLRTLVADVDVLDRRVRALEDAVPSSKRFALAAETGGGALTDEARRSLAEAVEQQGVGRPRPAAEDDDG